MSSTEESTRQSPMTKKAMRTGKRDIVIPPIRDGESGLMVRHIATKAMKGDLMLNVRDRGTGEQHFYLVDATTLRDASPYFRTLLDPSKFAEGIRLEERTKEIGKKHAGYNTVPLADLPVVTVDDVGQVPVQASTEAVFTLFLGILHTLVIPWAQPDWSSLATLAIIADRFDALQTVATFVASRGWTKRSFLWDERTHLGIKGEKSLRQQILVGLLFGIAPLLRKQTATLIVADSILWSEDDVAGKIDPEALWWDLPQGIEEEMSCRRGCLLETISSLQQHFINLYIFKPNQCKYGYDSSAACNSFQLGETIRFFSRHNTLSLESTFCPSLQTRTMRGNILELLLTLRACPGYQINSHHAHCGIRTRFLSCLEVIIPLAQVGISARSWTKDVAAESWEGSPLGGTWRYAPRSLEPSSAGCDVHRQVKAMYTAEERDWTFRPP